MIGVVAGLISFVPYVGSFTALVVSLGVAVDAVLSGLGHASRSSPRVVLVGQFLEGNMLSPWIVGNSVGLHPVWLMFALFAFGYLLGFVGLLLAVPLAAAAGVLIALCRAALPRKRRSTPVTDRISRHLIAAILSSHVSAMSSRPRQLALALDHAESYAREDFLSGPGNAEALTLIDSWPDWPAHRRCAGRAARIGQVASRAIWAAAAGARVISGRALDETGLLPALATGALVVEEAAAGGRARLFHLINLAREEEAFLLFTARTAPSVWPVVIADLASRLRALPVMTLQAPDDGLLRGLIVKLAADRQLALEEGVVALSRRPTSSARSRRRAPPSSRSTTRRCGRAARRAGRWPRKCSATALVGSAAAPPFAALCVYCRLRWQA